MTYTALSLVAVAVTLVLDMAVLRTRLLGRRSFWAAYGVVLVFQLVTNAVLTGLPVVRYDPATVVGVRVAAAPVEDLLFGFSLVAQTLAWWVWWGRRGIELEP